MGDPIMDSYGLVTVEKDILNILYGATKLLERVDAFNLALLGQEGLIPFFDPLNGIITEEEDLLMISSWTYTTNIGINVDYKIFDFSCYLSVRQGFLLPLVECGGHWAK